MTQHAPPGTRMLDGKYPVVTGLEHDELGHPTGSPKLHMAMTAKRREKLRQLAAELPVPEVYGDADAETLLVGWGSTYGPIREAVERTRAAGRKLASLHLRHVNPLPDGLGEIFEKFPKILVVEMNDEGVYGYGQLTTILRGRYCNPRITSLTKTDGLTFRVREILQSATPMSLTTEAPATPPAAPAPVPAPAAAPDKLTKKMLTADHPTWCPGCGDFAVLAAFYKALEKKNLPQEKIVTLAGIGCSSRFPYFVNSHGGHFIHGRAVPLASGVSLSRPDLHVFVFGGDGDGFSIGGNHLDHGARKNIRLTYVIMDNSVYGLTKKQTSPTSPIGFKSKTDPNGAIDQPVNPIKKLITGGATFVARTHASQINHMVATMERAMDHDGFSVVHVLSECVEFYPGAFDPAVPRKGGTFTLIEEKKNDGTPEDDLRHDLTDELAAYKLAGLPFPGAFGVFYEIKRPTKNTLEQKWISDVRARTGEASDLDLLRRTFERMR